MGSSVAALPRLAGDIEELVHSERESPPKLGVTEALCALAWTNPDITREPADDHQVCRAITTTNDHPDLTTRISYPMQLHLHRPTQISTFQSQTWDGGWCELKRQEIPTFDSPRIDVGHGSKRTRSLEEVPMVGTKAKAGNTTTTTPVDVVGLAVMDPASYETLAWMVHHLNSLKVKNRPAVTR